MIVLAAVRESRSQNGTLSMFKILQHLCPVGLPRKSTSQNAPHFSLSELACQPHLRSFRVSAGLVKPEERRAGPRQRGMESCLRRALAHKNSLGLCKGRMLAKHDSFKVILNPACDPGADKRGLLRSRKVLSMREDTGGARLPNLRFRKGAGIGATQLL